MENSDDISKFRVIRKKEPYVNNNAFIQPIIGGKSKDIDTINNTLRLRCRGNTGHNIRWMATIDTVEVTQ